MSRRAWLVAIVLFAVAATPTALVLIAIRSGAVGSVSAPGLVVMAFTEIALLAGAIGLFFDWGLDRVRASQARTMADAWVALYVAATVVVIGAFAIPVVTLVVMVNSDRSLQDSGAWFFVWWTAGHLLIAVVALGLGRLAFWADPAAPPVA